MTLDEQHKKEYRKLNIDRDSMISKFQEVCFYFHGFFTVKIFSLFVKTISSGLPLNLEKPGILNKHLKILTIFTCLVLKH